MASTSPYLLMKTLFSNIGILRQKNIQNHNKLGINQTAHPLSFYLHPNGPSAIVVPKKVKADFDISHFTQLFTNHQPVGYKNRISRADTWSDDVIDYVTFQLPGHSGLCPRALSAYLAT